MSILPKNPSDGGDIIGKAMETAYQIQRARDGKPYKPMGQEEIIEPLGKWVDRAAASRTGRQRS
jgi:hypothetical protein